MQSIIILCNPGESGTGAGLGAAGTRRPGVRHTCHESRDTAGTPAQVLRYPTRTRKTRNCRSASECSVCIAGMNITKFRKTPLTNMSFSL